MCGELIGEFQGKAIGTRIVELLENGLRLESTDQTTGRLLGIEAEDMATGLVICRFPDHFYAEGKGVVTSKAGEMAMYTEGNRRRNS
jgi:hypothetical protein